MTLQELIVAHIAEHGFPPGSPALSRAAGVSEWRARRALTDYYAAHPDTPRNPRDNTVSRVASLTVGVGEETPGTVEAPLPARAPQTIWDEQEHTATIESPKSALRTPEELLLHAGVDLELWHPERSVVNKWDATQRGLDGLPVVTPLYQVKVWLRRRHDVADLRRLKAETLDAIATHAPTYAPITRPPNSGGHLLMLSPSDAHLGKLAWAPETGNTYNLDVAVRTVRDALRSLTADALPLGLERICLVVGNDLMQADSPRGQTYAGTQVDVSNRYWEVFGAARDLMVGEVEWLTQFAPVSVVTCVGNHDRTASAHLGEVLAAWFRNHPEVTVDAAPTPRKYLRHGACLLGFAHGDEEKHAALPQIMAQERPQDWAQTTCREWITGHFHKAKQAHYAPLTQDGGVIVRTLPSLGGRDAWSVQRGYLTPAAAQAIVYARTGLKASFHHMPQEVA